MIKTFTGPMHSGKTAQMIATYNKIWNKDHILCFKPSIDSRDLGIMKSKDYGEGVPAICIEMFEDILKYLNDDISTIFIDEAQMIKGNVSVLSYLSVMKDMDIYVAGLNMTSEAEPFLTMPFILAISDEVVNVKASCFDCGREATYTYFNGEKTGEILVGDEGYIPLCHRCIKKREEKGQKLIFSLNKKNDREN